MTPSADTGRRLLTVGELRDGGYLFEVNRTFFHPLGLALAVDVDSDEPDAEALCYLLDRRDDLEGWIFSEDEATAEGDAALAAAVEAERERRRGPREAALGFWIQPVPEIG